YWLGESMFQRQRFRDAAEAFLNVSTKYESSAKAPDALLRLGQSLAALGEKEAACASLGEVLRKFPRASAGVKQGVEREQKGARSLTTRRPPPPPRRRRCSHRSPATTPLFWLFPAVPIPRHCCCSWRAGDAP